MAQRKNYFYKATLISVNNGEEVKDTKQFFSRLIERYGDKQVEEYIDIDGKMQTISYFPLEVSQDNEMHVIVDIFNFDDGYLFFRACKQKPSNSFNKRNYGTYKSEDFKIDNENKGIEQYTFGYYVYFSKILSIIKSTGTPDQKILNKLVNKYSIGYNVDIIDIPNKNGVQVLYNAKESQLSEIELEIPFIDPEILQNTFGWQGNELIEIGQNKNFKVKCILRSNAKGEMLSIDEGLIKKVINAINDTKTKYTKAKVKGKVGNEKMKKYNFFEENFSNEVNISISKKVDGCEKFYPVNQMVEIYKNCLITSYTENEEFLSIFSKE